jgi:hypothetical protein
MLPIRPETHSHDLPSDDRMSSLNIHDIFTRVDGLNKPLSPIVDDND